MYSLVGVDGNAYAIMGAVGFEGFVDERQATLGSHVVVSFHNTLKNNTLLNS